MNFLIIGSGAREHALARALARSKHKPTIFCCATSHNPGIESLASGYWVGDINSTDAVVEQARAWQIEIAIIGPEAPLEAGLADALMASSIAAIGPKKTLAQIETSKLFTRDLLEHYKVKASPEYRAFKDMYGVKEFLLHLGEDHYVIKANGLMGGKGVKVAGDHLHSIREALAFCEELIALGQTFVIEEKLIGQEFSLLCFSDGNRLIPMPAVQDHKRAFVGDKGPNTGGMGSYSDANHSLPFLTEKDLESAQHINESMINALTAKYRERYIGILYGSFMATQKGIKLIEFNARFGDPEALNVLSILESDFVDICTAMVAGTLHKGLVTFSNLATVCKYAVPEGYPDAPLKNGLIDINGVSNQELLYLGAVNQEGEKLYATGSRTVAAVGIAATLEEAEEKAEQMIQCVKGKLFHREDIGTRELIQQRIEQMKHLRQKQYGYF
jgi:phosphoribosylamine---glycine ligase